MMESARVKRSEQRGACGQPEACAVVLALCLPAGTSATVSAVMDWLDLVPLVAALATMALAFTLLTAGTEATRWLMDIVLQTAVALDIAFAARANHTVPEEL